MADIKHDAYDLRWHHKKPFVWASSVEFLHFRISQLKIKHLEESKQTLWSTDKIWQSNGPTGHPAIATHLKVRLDAVWSDTFDENNDAPLKPMAQ